MNWNILVTLGEENNSDSLSSGERTGTSPNQFCYGKIGVVGLRCDSLKYSRRCLESTTIEGESPVSEILMTSSSILSSARPEKSCMNLAAPSAKAKYSWETDSEQVPWGKGEKYPEQGSEIDPETMRLQTVGVPIYWGDSVPFA